ncbi:hypothetical protein EBU91_03525 [bacterium]|nr:hypothetical protein [bacterium]
MKEVSLNLKVFDTSDAFLFKVHDSRFNFKIGNTSTIIFLEKIDGFWNIPDFVDLTTRVILYTDITEAGGLTSSGPDSRIVCRVNGEKLKPYFIPNPKPNLGDHGFFATEYPVVSVQSYDHSYVSILIYKSYLDYRSRTCEISEKLIYDGRVTSIPNHLFQTYNIAVNYALIKGNCYNCTHLHYYTRKI